jgi:hypothetical protein
MSNLNAVTYSYAVAVTKSDSVDDAAGPFAGLLCTAAGTAIVWMYGGPQSANPVSIPVVAGQYLHFPIKRVGLLSSDVLGLVSSAITPQGFA